MYLVRVWLVIVCVREVRSFSEVGSFTDVRSFGEVGNI